MVTMSVFSRTCGRRKNTRPVKNNFKEILYLRIQVFLTKMIETAAVSNVRDITFWIKDVGRLNDISVESDILKTAQFFSKTYP
jgi:hypothetical protein